MTTYQTTIPRFSTEDDPSFGHADGSRFPRTRQVRSVTRFLSGAAYTEEAFARAAIAELLEDTHRAVVPNDTYDVVPVLRHCLRARRLWLLRDTLIIGVLIIALITAPQACALVVGLAQLLALPALIAWWRSRRPAHGVWQATAVILGLYLVMSCLLSTVALSGVALLQAVTATDSPPDGLAYADTTAADPVTSRHLFLALVIGVVIVAVVVSSRMVMLRTMTTTLAADSTDRGPEPGPVRCDTGWPRWTTHSEATSSCTPGTIRSLVPDGCSRPGRSRWN